MPRRSRPAETTRSEHWIRTVVNEFPEYLNRAIIEKLALDQSESIDWRSPLREDGYAEYSDQAFLDRLAITNLSHPLDSFWPQRGPCWDGLARTKSGKCLLIEAKAYIEEAVDYSSKATNLKSISRMSSALDEAKKAFQATPEAPWNSPYYQYANRLAHLYYLWGLNRVDAYLVFVYFADARDVPNPCTRDEWNGAIRLMKKSLGLQANEYGARIAEVIISVPEMVSNSKRD